MSHHKHHAAAGEEVRQPEPEIPGANGQAQELTGFESAPAEEPKAAEPEKKTDPAEQLKAELAEQQAKYLYLQAEYQNYRKRVSRDLSDTRINTTSSTLVPFLTVFDYLSMAETAALQSDNIDAIRQGLKMIIGEFRKAFDELGVVALNAAGEKFDPNRHEAVGHESSDTVPEGTVIRAWNCGFRMGEHLLRPARVVVSDGKAVPAEEKKEAPEKEA